MRRPTVKEIKEEEAGEIMDQWIAQFSMGFDVFVEPGGESHRSDPDGLIFSLPKYSSKMDATEELLLQNPEVFLYFEKGEWVADWFDMHDGERSGRARTIPLAVCRAILLNKVIGARP